MDEPSLQLASELQSSLAWGPRRPVLTHLNADTTWLLQIPLPIVEDGLPYNPAGRNNFNILIDPWLHGPQADVTRFLSQQWHAVESKVRTVAEVESLIRGIENGHGFVEGGRPRAESESGATKALLNAKSPIDAVIISHEFTDHCHRETLLEVDTDVPIFASKKAANLIRSWSHFKVVQEMPSFSTSNPDWRFLSRDPLPRWLSISRLESSSDLLYYHSAVLIAFRESLTVPRARTRDHPNEKEDSAEAVIYAPHGVHAEDLHCLKASNPPVRSLAFLHGLHDVSMGSQLNLGAHNGLKAQRILKAKYWLPTHDEIKKGFGLVSFFLKRKVLTVEDALEQERKDLEAAVEQGEFEDVHFVDLGNGESLLLD